MLEAELEMYDSLSADYDRFVDWNARLQVEMPFIEALIQKIGADETRVRVLDAACGTGMHAVALAQRGYQTAGADLSQGMIARAALNAERAGVRVEFRTAGFGELRRFFNGFDALVCLGNSLPHLHTLSELSSALDDFAACLRPGGLLLIQNRNFDAVLARHERWMSPEGYREASREWLFFRFYDFNPDQSLAFHVVTLTREGDTSWQQKIDSTRLYPQRRDELVAALEAAGFDRITAYGGMSGDPFAPQTSPNLVLVARTRTVTDEHILSQ
jgi:glycine/sarcosine N-methyltransferase